MSHDLLFFAFFRVLPLRNGRRVSEAINRKKGIVGPLIDTWILRVLVSPNAANQNGAAARPHAPAFQHGIDVVSGTRTANTLFCLARKSPRPNTAAPSRALPQLCPNTSAVVAAEKEAPARE
uniref:Uncharacterized protein n=1 Tax=Ustilago esculenta TaxID=185366 RepID=A0A481SHB1_9BASI|nr:hypothetical protein UE_1434 [Ustilago esculenta]